MPAPEWNVHTAAPSPVRSAITWPAIVGTMSSGPWASVWAMAGVPQMRPSIPSAIQTNASASSTLRGGLSVSMAYTRSSVVATKTVRPSSAATTPAITGAPVSSRTRALDPSRWMA